MLRQLSHPRYFLTSWGEKKEPKIVVIWIIDSLIRNKTRCTLRHIMRRTKEFRSILRKLLSSWVERMIPLLSFSCRVETEKVKTPSYMDVGLWDFLLVTCSTLTMLTSIFFFFLFFFFFFFLLNMLTSISSYIYLGFAHRKKLFR